MNRTKPKTLHPPPLGTPRGVRGAIEGTALWVEDPPPKLGAALRHEELLPGVTILNNQNRVLGAIILYL